MKAAARVVDVLEDTASVVSDDEDDESKGKDDDADDVEEEDDEEDDYEDADDTDGLGANGADSKSTATVTLSESNFTRFEQIVSPHSLTGSRSALESPVLTKNIIMSSSVDKSADDTDPDTSLLEFIANMRLNKLEPRSSLGMWTFYSHRRTAEFSSMQQLVDKLLGQAEEPAILGTELLDYHNHFHEVMPRRFVAQPRPDISPLL